MKVLVTGAAGFLGRYVVDALLRRGHKVTALVRPATDLVARSWANDVEVFRADLRLPSDLAAALSGTDAVVHLAARLTGGDEEQFAAAVVGTERLLVAMAQANVRRLILASSYSVYDWSQARNPLSEDSPVDDPYRRRDAYATAKIWQERIARRSRDAGEIDLTVLRPGYIWGRERPWADGAGELVGRVALVVAPRARPPLTYVENCADYFSATVDSDVAIDRTFNVVDEPGITAWRFAGEFLARNSPKDVRVPIPYALGWVIVNLIGRSSRLLFGERGRLPSLADPLLFEGRFKPLEHTTDAARQVLNWTPPFSFTEALERAHPGS